jgi:hypothetical protein
MAITTSYTRGVKYIKVSRFDANGVDQSNQLQNINNIRMLFSDYVNPIDYPAVSITEYPDYYLYTIIPTDVTSSTDNQILNYKVSGSSLTINNVSSTYPAVGGWVGLINNFTIQGGTNTLTYFTASSGYWTFGNTPNVPMIVTCSVDYSVVSMGGVGMELDLYNINNLTTPPYTPLLSTGSGIIFTGTYNLTLAGSFIPIEGETYVWILRNVANNTAASSTTTQFLSTQSITPASPGTTLTVLEPYIDEKFKGSDCNVLQNNVVLNSPNAFYMVVDYTNGSIIATNQQAILNGSATRAQIQNWNYTYASQISGRYIGREQNAITYNTYTSSSQFVTKSEFGFTGSWPGDTTSPLINGSVVVEYLDSCIYTTNWGGGGYPENANGGGLQTNNILLVGSTKDDVASFPEDNISYFDILNKNIPYGTEFLIKQYNQTANTTIKATSLYPGISLNDAAYWIPSNFDGNGNGSVGEHVGKFYPTGSGSINQALIQLYSTASVGNEVYINRGTRVNNIQQTGSAQLLHLALTNISNSISSGIPYFASLYNGSGSLSSTSSIPGLPPSTNGLPNVYQIGYPFEISKIQYNPSFVSGAITATWELYVKNAPSTLFNGIPNPSWIGSEYSTVQTYGLGLILTSGNPSSNFITSWIPTPSGSWSRFSNIGTGYITTQYPKNQITENATYITKTYGNNPNP